MTDRDSSRARFERSAISSPCVPPAEPTPSASIESTAPPLGPASTPESPAVPEAEIPAAPTSIPIENEPIIAVEPETQTAQMGRNEPLVAESEPLPQESAPQASAPAPVADTITFRGRDILAKASAKIQEKKLKKREKILEFLNAKGKISNDEVEKLLHVSDATATRYLSALEKEGKIQQLGKTGKGVIYTKSA